MSEYKKEVVKKTYGEEVHIKYLKEFPTPRNNMIEYLKGEFIVRPECQKKYKNRDEVYAYNDGIQCAIQMIGSFGANLQDEKKV